MQNRADLLVESRGVGQQGSSVESRQVKLPSDIRISQIGKNGGYMTMVEYKQEVVYVSFQRDGQLDQKTYIPGEWEALLKTV